MNIDNKINLLANTNHIHINSENNANINNNSLKNSLYNDNISNNDIDDYSYNTIDAIHYNRVDKKNDEMKKEKNISVELRKRWKNRGAIIFDDIDEINYNENQKISIINNPIYSKIYKSNSQNSNNNKYEIIKLGIILLIIVSDRIEEIHNSNKYINEKSQKIIFNNHFNKINNNYYNMNRNHFYSINENKFINKKEDKNKTANNFYVNRNQISAARNINNNYFNYINSKNNIIIFPFQSTYF